jgi:hypothetical protein
MVDIKRTTSTITLKVYDRNTQIKSQRLAGHWWLMPVILATWKAEIGRTAV